MRLFSSVRSSASNYSFRVINSPLPVSLTSPGALALLVFVAFYLLVLQSIRSVSYRDPTSLFFDPQRGYEPAYSSVRQAEADAFIEDAGRATFEPHKAAGGQGKNLCVGIATIAREGARYFRTAVGSLLEGLNEEERRSITLIVFIAHTDPSVHPAHSEKWLYNVADKVLVYDLPEKEMEHIRLLENDRSLFREKALFDYTYLLNACSATAAPYIAMIEDDVIAVDCWYHRTLEALDRTVKQTHSKGALDFFYLRLFYTEEFLGWNSEEWPRYLSWSLVWVLVPVLCLIGLRNYRPIFRKYISDRSILVSCGICIPMCVALFFAAGKVTMLPLPAGVNEMPAFGCCSQSLVYPQSRVPDLIKWYEAKRIGFVDMLTEELADKNHELRWALTPSPMQHIGRKSSKGDDFGKNSKYHMRVAEKLWNFAFERNDARALRTDHTRHAAVPVQ